LRSDDGIVRIKQGMPVTVAHLRGPARRVHHVGEQHRREDPIAGHVSLLTGEERGDFLERVAPSRFEGVVQVAPRNFDVFRAWYVVSDVLAHRGRDQWVVGMVDNERRHADCREQCPHVHLTNHRQHEIDGPRARGQSLVSCTCCPDFFIPRHVWIQRMCEFPCPPHGCYGSDGIRGIGSLDR